MGVVCASVDDGLFSHDFSWLGRNEAHGSYFSLFISCFLQHKSLCFKIGSLTGPFPLICGILFYNFSPNVKPCYLFSSVSCFIPWVSLFDTRNEATDLYFPGMHAPPRKFSRLPRRAPRKDSVTPPQWYREMSRCRVQGKCSDITNSLGNQKLCYQH